MDQRLPPPRSLVLTSLTMPSVSPAALRRQHLGWCFLITIVVTLVYWNSLGVPFLFDDADAVSRNPTIRQLASLDVLTPPTDGSTTTGRPIVNLSYALNFAIGGEHAWGYHVLNVAIHVFAALALWGVVRRTLLAPGLRETAFVGAAPLAGFVALLWALHPLQTESVVCIAQRTESLCGLFYLLTLYGFIRSCETPASTPRRPTWRWAAFSVLMCLLGMGTKEVMVTAPLLVLLYDRTFFAGSFAAAWRQRRGYYVALASTGLLLIALLAGMGGARGASAGFGLSISWWSYLLKQNEALLRYLWLAFWPHPLVLDYGTAVTRSIADVWWQGPLVLTLLAATIWALVRRPILGFIGAWFFLILAPSSSVVPLVTQTMAEHRMYLPLAAIVAIVAWGLQRRRVLIWGGTLLVVLFAALTIARNHDYRDAVAIWSDNVTHYPQSARGHNNLALALHRAGKSSEADQHFATALRLQPDYVSALHNWGTALLEQGRAHEAVARLQAAVRLAPAHLDARVNLGNALVRAQRPAEAVSHFEAALRIRPAADLHYNLGCAFLELAQSSDAAGQFRAALRLDPNLPEAHARLGLLLARAGQLAEARMQLSDAARLQPTNADLQANLGNVLLMLGEVREAITHYETSLRLRPDDLRVRENLQLARESLR